MKFQIGLKNKQKFVYNIANCNYNGSVSQGNMKLYVSRSLRRLFRKAIHDLINSNKEIQQLKKITNIIL